MSFQRNVLAHFAARAWLALIVLACVPLYVRLLGVEAWGLAGFFASLLLWVTLLDVGLGQAVTREMALFTAGTTPAPLLRDTLRSVEVVCALLGAASAAVLWLAAPVLASAWLRAMSLTHTEVTDALRLMGLVIALRFLESLYAGGLLGLQRVVPLSVMNIALSTLRWGGAAAVLWLVAPTLQAFLLWQLAVSVLAVGVLGLALYRSLPAVDAPARVQAGALARIWPFARGVAATTLLGLLLTQVDKVLLPRLVGLHEYGYYVLAATLATGVVHLVGPLAEVVRVRLTGVLASGDTGLVTETYHTGAQLAAVIALPPAFVLAFFSFDVLQLWTGDAQLARATAPLLSLLVVGSLLNALMYVPYALQLAAGWPGLAARINAVALLVLVPALLWAVPRHGTQGAAWVWVLLNTGYLTIGIHQMHRRLIPAEKWRWYLVDLGPPAAASALLVAAASLLRPAQGGATARAGWLLLAGVLAVLAAALAAPRARVELLRLLRRSAGYLT